MIAMQASLLVLHGPCTGSACRTLMWSARTRESNKEMTLKEERIVAMGLQLLCTCNSAEVGVRGSWDYNKISLP